MSRSQVKLKKWLAKSESAAAPPVESLLLSDEMTQFLDSTLTEETDEGMLPETVSSVLARPLDAISVYCPTAAILQSNNSSSRMPSSYTLNIDTRGDGFDLMAESNSSLNLTNFSATISGSASRKFRDTVSSLNVLWLKRRAAFEREEGEYSQAVATLGEAVDLFIGTKEYEKADLRGNKEEIEPAELVEHIEATSFLYDITAHISAGRIQRFLKRYYTTRLNAATMITKSVRGFLKRIQWWRRKDMREQCATLIARRYRIRYRYLCLMSTKIKRWYQMRMVMYHFGQVRRRHRAAKFIQRVWRGCRGRNRAAYKRCYLLMVMKVQRNYRGYVTRRTRCFGLSLYHQYFFYAARVIQSLVRRVQSTNKVQAKLIHELTVEDERLEREHAVVNRVIKRELRRTNYYLKTPTGRMHRSFIRQQLQLKDARLLLKSDTDKSIDMCELQTIVCFDILDTDGDRKLSINDLQMGLQSLLIILTEKSTRKLAAEITSEYEEQGGISYRDFARWFQDDDSDSDKSSLSPKIKIKISDRLEWLEARGQLLELRADREMVKTCCQRAAISAQIAFRRDHPPKYQCCQCRQVFVLFSEYFGHFTAAATASATATTATTAAATGAAAAAASVSSCGSGAGGRCSVTSRPAMFFKDFWLGDQWSKQRQCEYEVMRYNEENEVLAYDATRAWFANLDVLDTTSITSSITNSSISTSISNITSGVMLSPLSWLVRRQVAASKRVLNGEIDGTLLLLQAQSSGNVPGNVPPGDDTGTSIDADVDAAVAVGKADADVDNNVNDDGDDEASDATATGKKKKSKIKKQTTKSESNNNNNNKDKAIGAVEEEEEEEEGEDDEHGDKNKKSKKVAEAAAAASLSSKKQKKGKKGKKKNIKNKSPSLMGSSDDVDSDHTTETGPPSSAKKKDAAASASKKSKSKVVEDEVASDDESPSSSSKNNDKKKKKSKSKSKSKSRAKDNVADGVGASNDDDDDDDESSEEGDDGSSNKKKKKKDKSSSSKNKRKSSKSKKSKKKSKNKNEDKKNKNDALLAGDDNTGTQAAAEVATKKLMTYSHHVIDVCASDTYLTYLLAHLLCVKLGTNLPRSFTVDDRIEGRHIRDWLLGMVNTGAGAAGGVHDPKPPDSNSSDNNGTNNGSTPGGISSNTTVSVSAAPAPPPPAIVDPEINNKGIDNVNKGPGEKEEESLFAPLYVVIVKQRLLLALPRLYVHSLRLIHAALVEKILSLATYRLSYPRLTDLDDELLLSKGLNHITSASFVTAHTLLAKRITIVQERINVLATVQNSGCIPLSLRTEARIDPGASLTIKEDALKAKSLTAEYARTEALTRRWLGQSLWRKKTLSLGKALKTSYRLFTSSAPKEGSTSSFQVGEFRYLFHRLTSTPDENDAASAEQEDAVDAAAGVDVNTDTPTLQKQKQKRFDTADFAIMQNTLSLSIKPDSMDTVVMEILHAATGTMDRSGTGTGTGMGTSSGLSLGRDELEQWLSSDGDLPYRNRSTLNRVLNTLADGARVATFTVFSHHARTLLLLAERRRTRIKLRALDACLQYSGDSDDILLEGLETLLTGEESVIPELAHARIDADSMELEVANRRPWTLRANITAAAAAGVVRRFTSTVYSGVKKLVSNPTIVPVHAPAASTDPATYARMIKFQDFLRRVQDTATKQVAEFLRKTVPGTLLLHREKIRVKALWRKYFDSDLITTAASNLKPATTTPPSVAAVIGYVAELMSDGGGVLNTEIPNLVSVLVKNFRLQPQPSDDDDDDEAKNKLQKLLTTLADLRGKRDIYRMSVQDVTDMLEGVFLPLQEGVRHHPVLRLLLAPGANSLSRRQHCVVAMTSRARQQAVAVSLRFEFVDYSETRYRCASLGLHAVVRQVARGVKEGIPGMKFQQQKRVPREATSLLLLAEGFSLKQVASEKIRVVTRMGEDGEVAWRKVNVAEIMQAAYAAEGSLFAIVPMAVRGFYRRLSPVSYGQELIYLLDAMSLYKEDIDRIGEELLSEVLTGLPTHIPDDD